MNLKPQHERIKEKLKCRIKENRDKNKLPIRGRFLGIEDLKEILTFDDIKTLLREDFPNMDDEALEHWCVVIRDHRRKSYTILILEDMADKIDQLDKDNHELHDEALFNQPFSNTGPCDFPWEPVDSNIAKILKEWQWIVPPRLLNNVHQTFPAKLFRFPFVQESERIGYGSFGTVHETKIAEGHLDYADGYDSHTPIVYKRVRQEENRGLGWSRLLNEVRTLRERAHSHVTPLLSSFAAGNALATSDSDAQENLYMILPKADGDMEKWMKNDPGYLEDFASRRDYIYEIMISIVSGVAYIHKEIKGTVGFHHDLSPKNILHFSRANSKTPVWKICDFGGSNLKDTMGDTGTSHEIGTPTYAPPEFFEKNGSKHGRAYDMFSLGCILLELATILKYGWTDDGLENFTQLRLQNERRDTSRHPKAYYSNMDIVKYWITRLKQDASIPFRHVLEFIEETLVGRYQRIFAWELEIDLRWTKDPETPPNDIFGRLRDIAQAARKPTNAISTFHNPLRRARRMDRPDEFLAILRSKGWSDNDPGSTEALHRSQQANVQEYFSTLVAPLDTSPLYGRHKENKMLEEQFALTNIIGLFGLGGIGKSYIALHYAQQFHETPIANAKKHTFWVNADSIASVWHSYMEIAFKVKLNPLNLEFRELCNAVKAWLENFTHGPWILVVDGLDSEKVAEKLEGLLPRKDTGQILITGRSKECLRTACGYDMTCWEVQKPEPQDCLKIFRHHLVDSYYDEDVQGTGNLLDRLWLPLVIKMAASYMNKYEISNQKMCDRIDQSEFAFDQIKEFKPDIMKFFLKPLFEVSDNGTPPGKSDGWSNELRLLCFLACLSKDNVDIKLIKANYPESEHPAVATRLAKLVHYAFIENIADDTYRMHKFVQDSLVAWIRDQKKEIGLFQRLEIALAALLNRYEEKKRTEHGDRASLMHRSSYSWKIPFMPHFARFEEFASQARRRRLPNTFKFKEKAINSIDAFSQFYLEQGRPQAAVEVLEFAQRHRDDGANSKFRLGRKLAQAYVARASTGPHDDRNPDWGNAATLLKGLIQDADEADKLLLKWELVLELIRLYHQSNQCTKAWEQLRLMKIFEFRTRKGRVGLVRRKAFENALPQWDDPKTLKKWRMLIIRVRYEEGLVRLALGHNHLENGRKLRASWSWKYAKQAFLDSKHAQEQWLNEESEFSIQIEASIAEVNSCIGTEPLLSEAEEMLQRQIIQLRDVFEVSDKRVWETEYRLAAVLLKGNKAKVEEAIDVLKRLEKSHSELFGDRNGDTRKCASLLGKAYLKAGMNFELRQLEIRYDFSMGSDDEKQRRLQKGNYLYDFNQLAVVVGTLAITIVIPFWVAVVFLLLQKGKS